MTDDQYVEFLAKEGLTEESAFRMDRETWIELQNKFLISISPLLQFLIDNGDIKQELTRKWRCNKCQIPPVEMVSALKSHYKSATHYAYVKRAMEAKNVSLMD